MTSAASAASENIQTEEPYYDAIPDMPDPPVKPKLSNYILKKPRQQSPPKHQPTEPTTTKAEAAPTAGSTSLATVPTASSHSEIKEELVRKTSDKTQPQRIKKKSQRSSSLGPLLDEPPPLGSSMANTNSLESIDSNPRQKMPKGKFLPLFIVFLKL